MAITNNNYKRAQIVSVNNNWLNAIEVFNS